MTINRFVRFRALIVIQLVIFPVTRCYFDTSEFEQRTMALFRLVNYLVGRPEQMNVDGLYGMTLAEAHLSATLCHVNVFFLPPEYRGIVAKIRQFLHHARVYTRTKVNPESQEVASINAILNEPSLWIRSINWQSGKIGPRPKPSLGIDRAFVEESILRGSPQERESDMCIGQLVINGGKMVYEGCNISENCTEMLLRKDNSAGYPLTHRLLYVQTAKALNCRENQRINFVKLIPEYCREILQNLVDAEATNFPGVSRDLAIEQVLLCGMEGFLEFANNHYAKLLRKWAHPLGCYNSRGFVVQPDNPTNWTLSLAKIAKRTKRSSGTMDFGCENHASGLAAGTLALLIREIVENAFEENFDSRR